jgi:hypothetical protein
LALSLRAALGGSLIFASAVAAFVVVFRKVWHEREFGRLALLLVPVFTLLAALHFAFSCPYDDYGVVKGIYMQFGSAPLYGLFGLAVGWAHEKPRHWWIATVLWASLWMVAAYTLYCRFRLPIIPL